MKQASARVPVLRVNGTPYYGWKSVEMQNSLDQLCGSFGAAITFKVGVNIKMGDAYTLELSDPNNYDVNSVIFQGGWIDGMENSYDAETHDITLTGRDVTCDLVDCSIVGKDFPSSWRNVTLRSLIEALCAPFEIPVEFIGEAATTGAEKVLYARADEGDTVSKLIEKVCASFAKLPLSYGDGRLTIARAGAALARDKIEVGYNVKSGSLAADDSQRFSKYVVKGQGSGKSDWGQEVTWQFKGEAEDALIKRQRYRPIVVTSQDSRNAAQAKTEAEWTARQRVASARRYSYKLAGWEQSDSARTPWELNSLVEVTDPFFGLDKHQLLIQEVKRSLDEDSGSITELALVEPDCYALKKTMLTFPNNAAERSWGAGPAAAMQDPALAAEAAAWNARS